MRLRWIVSSFLTIGAIFSLWLVWHYVFTLAIAPPSNPNFPDAFVNNLTVTVMDDSGNRQYAFTSPTMTHYTTDDKTLFSTPHLLMFEQQEPPWIIDANQGEAMHGNATIHLWGNVVIQQAASAYNQSSLIKTTSLMIYPQTRIVTTDQYISAIQPDGEMDSVGMRLDVGQKTLDLLSQVHGYYVPQKKH